MTEHDWHDPALRTVLVRLESQDQDGRTDTVLVVLHAGAEPTWVVLTTEDPAYELVLDTRADAVTASGDTSAYRFGPGARVEVAPRSMVVLAAAP